MKAFPAHMLAPYVCVAGMITISVVLYILDPIDPWICGFLIYLFVTFSLFERGRSLGEL